MKDKMSGYLNKVFYIDIDFGNMIFLNVKCMRMSEELLQINERDFSYIVKQDNRRINKKGKVKMLDSKTKSYKDFYYAKLHGSGISLGVIKLEGQKIESNTLSVFYLEYFKSKLSKRVLKEVFTPEEIKDMKTAKKFHPHDEKLLKVTNNQEPKKQFVCDILYNDRIFLDVIVQEGDDKRYSIMIEMKRRIANKDGKIIDGEKVIQIGLGNSVGIAKLTVHQLDGTFSIDQFNFYSEAKSEAERKFGVNVAKRLLYTNIKAYVPFVKNKQLESQIQGSRIKEESSSTSRQLHSLTSSNAFKQVTEYLAPKPITISASTSVVREVFHKEKPRQREEILGPVNRVSTTVNVAVRNQTLVNEIKKKYKDTCQLCGERIEIGLNLYMSEAHHIHPLGKIHEGPDVLSNLIVLCPNHHTMFDRGAVSIDLEKKMVIHINPNHLLHKKALTVLHNINPEFVRYHHTYIFKGSRLCGQTPPKEVIEPTQSTGKNRIDYGDCVTVRDHESGEQFDVQLEEKANQSFMQPLAAALLYKDSNSLLQYNGVIYEIISIKSKHVN